MSNKSNRPVVSRISSFVRSFYLRNKKMTIAVLSTLGLPVMALLMGIGFVWEYETKGEIVYKSYHIYGSGARATAWLTLFCGVIIFIYSIFLISKDWGNLRKRKLYKSEVDNPKYVKCPHCKGVFFGHQVIDLTCPSCAAKLEDLKEYYGSHPEERFGVDDNGDSARISRTFSILAMVILLFFFIVIMSGLR